MKRIISVLLISCLCFALVSCGNETLVGEPTVFKNAKGSFSIELPAKEAEDKEDPSWIINEDTDGDILDMTDYAETVRVIVQGVSKAKVSRVAADFKTYQTYVTENTVADILKGSPLKECNIDVPEFITNSYAGTYTTKQCEGIIVFMETDSTYYTYMVVAAEGGYKANEKALKESILSLKELPSSGSEDNKEKTSE